MEQKQSCICDRLPTLSIKYPCLVAQNLKDNVSEQIFYSLNDPLSEYHCQIPELLGRRIRGCFHGWLILSNNMLWSLWNPVTCKMIHFPKLNLNDGDSESLGHCCLSSPPDDPSSVLLLTNTKDPNFVFCRLDRKRKRLRWTEMSYNKQLKRITGEDGLLLHSLTCCNGKVYALNTDGSFAFFVVQVDIVVKNRQVLIKLSLFGGCPSPSFNTCPHIIDYLIGSCTELFYIWVAFRNKAESTPAVVYLSKLDMTSIKCHEMEAFKDLDMTSKNWKEMEDLELLDMTTDMWEEIEDLKDAVFFVDVDRDYSVFYSSVIDSALGGFIHIRGKMGNIIYSYHIKNKTISLSCMPSPVLPTSHVTLWECRFKDDREEEEEEEEGKCILDSKKKKDEMVVRSITDDGLDSEMLNLPFHVLERIMDFCVGVEYMNFRATCKQCYLAAPLIQWRAETALRRLRFYSLVSPWLMVVDKNQGVVTFTDPLLGDNYYIKKFQVSIAEEGLCCSRFGWLLFDSDDYRCLVFFNPFTSDLIRLPETDDCFTCVCFSAPPTSADCMVVGFSIKRDVLIHFVAQGPFWHTLSLGADIYSIRSPTFYGRDLYALCNKGEVIVLKDLGEEEYYSWKVFEAKAPISCCLSQAEYFLVKRNQHLVLVVVGEFGEVVEVFKWNENEEEWEKIDGLGRHAIYVCNTTCFCIEAKVPEMENNIYFPRLHSKNGRMVFYSLESGMYHTFRNGKNIKDTFNNFFGTHHHLNLHAWIEPSWS